MNDEHLDTIYDVTDTLMSNGHFAALDTLLEQLDMNQDKEILLAWLVATLPGHNKLKQRTPLYNVLLNVFDPNVLIGLIPTDSANT